MKHANNTVLFIGLLFLSDAGAFSAPPHIPTIDHQPISSDTGLPLFPTPPAPVPAVPGDEHESTSLADLPLEQAMSFLQNFIESQSEDHIVTALSGLPIAKSKQIIERIITSTVPPTFAAYIILGITAHYKTNKERAELFSLFEKYPVLLKGRPLLLIAADSLYPSSINHLLAWANAHAGASSLVSPTSLISAALSFALKQNDATQLKTLQDHAQVITPENASSWLWQAVTSNSDPSILKFFVDQGANINTEKNGETLLTHAVEQLNFQTVATLIQIAQNDASINLTQWINHRVDPTIGTPLHVTLQLQKGKRLSDEQKALLTQIELELRRNGASIHEQ